MSKERAGIERAIMANVFASNKFAGDSKNKFATLVTEQNTFNKSFLATANAKIINYYKKTVQGSDIDEVNKMRKIAFEANTIGGFGIDSEYWFKSISQKINYLKKVDDFQANLLIQEANKIANSAYNSLLVLVALAVSLVVGASILGVIIANRMVHSLEHFQGGLKEFFSFLNYEINDVTLLKNESKDEFGQMAKNVNENILKTKENILQDRKLIDETIEVSDRINKGYLDGEIQTTSSNPALNELKNILNETMKSLSDNLENIKKVLISYSNSNYLPNVDKNSMEGVIEELIDGVNSLGNTVTDTLVVNKRNGLILENSANTLLENVDKLNTSSNEAASSLEETAAALEEITSTIINNSDNVTSMAKYADRVTKSAKDGEALANNTMVAMDDINEHVTSINEANYCH